MKHLGIHKFLWLVIVLIFSLADIIITYFIYIIHILWNFQIPRNWWSFCHEYEVIELSDDSTKISFKTKTDKNILETIKRRYRLVFK